MVVSLGNHTFAIRFLVILSCYQKDKPISLYRRAQSGKNIFETILLFTHIVLPLPSQNPFMGNLDVIVNRHKKTR
jgi:hypothetical protein